ncbi:MAG TPA: NADH-quinone oxidoreductase subunit NuoE [Jiangellaceae bacterium]
MNATGGVSGEASERAQWSAERSEVARGASKEPSATSASSGEASERSQWLADRSEIAKGGRKEPAGARETALNETARAEMREIIARYPEPRSALLPMLHLVQAYEGYVTPAGIEMCAEELGLTEAEVAAVATFYTMYKRRPMGEYHVGVCTNTLCAIMGGDQIWSELTDELGIGHDETTDDGMVSLERVECNAACDFAPVMVVNWEFMDNQTPQTARELVGKLRSGEQVQSTRGPGICTWKQAARILAGFPDGRATEGPPAGAASLAGLVLAQEKGWTAPEGGRPALGAGGSHSQEDDR